MIIAIGNVGSTSLKTKIVDIRDSGETKTLGEAGLDQIKTPGESTFTYCVGHAAKEKETVEICGFEAGIAHIIDWYLAKGVISKPSDIQAMGFKTVMGITNGANNLTPAILDEMRKFLFVSPVHNGPYLEAIEQFRRIVDVPMVGVFEPSFHYTIPGFRRCLGLPWSWCNAGVRKLGFHGSSHRYLTAAGLKTLGRRGAKLITIHLGGSSSLCASLAGKSVDVSHGFSPNSGIPQGSRPGDTDSGAVLYAMKELGLSIEQAQEQLCNDAGIRGMAGIGTDDVRCILEAALSGNKRAEMAIDMYVDGIRKFIAGFATTLNGPDAIVFGGGIGENSAEIRKRCLEGLEFMGIRLDDGRNVACIGDEAEISTSDSAIRVFVVPTNEEVVVATFTKRVVEAGRDLSPEEMVFSL